MDKQTKDLIDGMLETVTDIRRDADSEIEWIVRGLIGRDIFTLIHGDGKLGKSMILLDMLKAAVDDRPFAGHFHTGPIECDGEGVVGGGVLWLSEEGTRSFDRNMARVGYDRSQDYGWLKRLPLYNAAMWGIDKFNKILLDYVKEVKPAVIVIDPFNTWAGVENENDSAEVTRGMHVYNMIAKADIGVAVVLIDHNRKSGGANMASVRGSTAKTSIPDIIMGMERESGTNTTTVRIDGRFTEDAPNEFQLLWEQGHPFQYQAMDDGAPDPIGPMLKVGVSYTLKDIVRLLGLDYGAKAVRDRIRNRVNSDNTVTAIKEEGTRSYNYMRKVNG